ncbi:MAG: hypothetical protein KAT06_01835 [Gammaproteobacteria bacterium]|nr:hypothetical protein [Gammaproteobacteria bacterium]
MKKLHLQKQKGSVLILSLMILVVLTMIGISSMSSSSLQEKMAGNFRDREIAFQAAEMALSAAESYVMATINTANLDNTNGLYSEFNGPAAYNAFTGNGSSIDNWWTGTGTDSVELSTTITEVRTQPRYTIEVREQVGEDSGTNINIGGYGESTGGGIITSFRVTARGTGKSNNTVVILQSNYGKRL